SFWLVDVQVSLVLPTVLQLSSETCLVDKQSLNLLSFLMSESDMRILISQHYCDLVSALFKPSDYIPLALRILAFLCSKPPHPIRYYKLPHVPTSTSTVTTGKQSNMHRPSIHKKPYSCPYLTCYAYYRKQRRSVPYSRLRRQERHCHGKRSGSGNPGLCWLLWFWIPRPPAGS
ncbi:hypothetical protein BDN70DRAFT_976887, partial [Pholiota conissans]